MYQTSEYLEPKEGLEMFDPHQVWAGKGWILRLRWSNQCRGSMWSRFPSSMRVSRSMWTNMWWQPMTTKQRWFFIFYTFPLIPVFASQDALEVMLVSEWVCCTLALVSGTDSVSQSVSQSVMVDNYLIVAWLYWFDSGEWGTLTEDIYWSTWFTCFTYSGKNQSSVKNVKCFPLIRE